MAKKNYQKYLPLFLLLLFASTLFISFQTVSAQVVPTTAIQICQSRFFWGGHSWNWNSMPLFGVAISGRNQPILTVEGQSITNSWQGAWVSEGRISKPSTTTSVQVDVALDNLPSSAASAGIWFVKDNQNALIVNKHRDITDPQYNSNVFIIERVNGSDSFKYVSPDLPSSNFDTYKIQKTSTGYNVYYNGALVYTGTLDVSQFNKVEINGIARIGGDQVRARFRNYQEFNQPGPPGFYWSGQTWNMVQANGITVTGENQPILTSEGTGTSSGWQSYGYLQKTLTTNTASIDMASYPLPASIGSASFWFVKDEQNAIIIEKHRDIIFPNYNSNLFIVERVNGGDTHAFVHPDPPSSGWDNYRITKIPGGFEIYYNNTLVYTGSVDLTGFNKVRIAGYVHAAGDQVKSTFKNYQEQ